MFDPYRKWLGIPEWEQPAHHYRLLGITVFENDPDVIEAAADRQMAFIRTYQSGQHSAISQKILNELSAARVCLLNPEKKKAYDSRLRMELAQKAGQVQVAGPPFGFFVAGAAKYFGVQTRRLATVLWTLPAAYLALGEDVFTGGRCRQQLADLYARLEEVTGRLAALRPPAAPDAVGPAGEQAAPPGLFTRVKGAIQRAYFTERRKSLLRKIGKAAYEIEGVAGGPKGLAETVRQNLARMEEMRHEVTLLSEVPANTWLSPKRLAWMVLAILGVFVLLLLWARTVL